MKSQRIVILGVLAVTEGLLQGCSAVQPAWEAQSYKYGYLNLRAVPTDQVKLHRECAFLYYEMAEVEDFLQKYANIGHSDDWTPLWTATAKRRSADLASRYKQIRCQIRPAAPAKLS